MAEPLDVLVKAIVAKCLASPTIVNLGPISRKEKRTDKETVNSYVILDEDGDSEMVRTTCENEYWEHSILFKLYSTSPETCASMATVLKAVFDPDSLSLTLSEGKVISKRSGQTGYAKQDKSVWYAAIRYLFETSKPRA